MGQGQFRSIILLWPEVKFSTWPFEVKKYTFYCVLKGETRWCLNYFAIILSSKAICEKQYILKSLYCLLWPELEGSRYDPNRLNRVSLDSEHPKDSFGLCPTVTYISIRGEMAWEVATLWCCNPLALLTGVVHSGHIFRFQVQSAVPKMSCKIPGQGQIMSPGTIITLGIT